jgi:drug/metabolite transporter (DMT)-like permease
MLGQCVIVKKKRRVQLMNSISRLRAVSLMILVALFWSMAGVVTRQLEVTQGFEVTFWRSAFAALTFAVTLTMMRGYVFWQELLYSPKVIWVSGICWAIMFTAFMVAITLTTVANVLIVMALSPLITALFARLFLQHQLPLTTWLAIVVASLGIVWMFLYSEDNTFSLTGSLVSLGIPIAAAVNYTILQKVGLNRASKTIGPDGLHVQDMLPALLIGAILSTLATLPLSWPFQTSAHDLGLLSLLGVFQLALPCFLVVHLTRKLSAPEISLLAQLEVIFGVTWAWLWAGEELSTNTLSGGSLVLVALIANELIRIFRHQRSRKMIL